MVELALHHSLILSDSSAVKLRECALTAVIDKSQNNVNLTLVITILKWIWLPWIYTS